MGLTDRLPQGWTRSQRAVLIGFLVLILGYLLIETWRRPTVVADPPADPARGLEVADRIDPNTADLGTLKALPNLGEKRAKEIIAYREKVVSSGRDMIAFRTSFDLLKVKGIGTGMVANLKPYLRFPDESAATTRPNE